MTERINHEAKALELVEHIESVDNWMDFAPNAMNVAKIRATLALVEQQRIANLIAWTTANGTEPLKPEAKRITEALGL